MNVTCTIFGHHSEPGKLNTDEVGYLKVRVTMRDRDKYMHRIVQAKCSRCGKWFDVGILKMEKDKGV